MAYQQKVTVVDARKMPKVTNVGSAWKVMPSGRIVDPPGKGSKKHGKRKPGGHKRMRRYPY